MSKKQIEEAAMRLKAAQRVACLTGAGVSAESGIATFRDAQTGLWTKFDPERLASQAGFAADPGLVWRWYMERLERVALTTPNPGHVALAKLRLRAPQFTLITQNVDDLHERAGSSDVLHLHGSLARFRCNACRAEHSLTQDERQHDMPPRCMACGEYIRPDVVWFGEMLPRGILDQAWRAAEQCDAMVVVGTSGNVYPAAQLPFIAAQAGAFIIDINPEPTSISEASHLFLQGESGEVLPTLLARLEEISQR